MAPPNNKYDRQLRIWGNEGQQALEQASICLLNCGPTGAEALKNLVLGGIGSVTIVDACTVELADLGNNFLVDWESIGISRAKSVCALLEELNDSVVTRLVDESPEALIKSNPTFFSQFNLVIATQMGEGSLLKLDAICREQNVMLLIARSYGLTGLVRISLKEHCIIEAKPNDVLDDLRLHKPWKELKRFVDEFDIETDDSFIHKHIPYVVLLIKAAEKWRGSHNAMLPSTSKEKNEFKDLIASMRHAEDEDNYKEALRFCYKLWSPPTKSQDLCQILDDHATEVNSISSDFWVMVAALKEFIANEGNGELPLDGAIPDMTCLTEYYVALQKIYQAQAEVDALILETRVKRILKEVGRDVNSVSRGSLKQFCKNARHIKVLRYQTLEEEYSSCSAPALQRLLTAEDNRVIASAEMGAELIGAEAKEKCSLFRTKNIIPNIYVLLRAVDHFAVSYNRFPGVFDREVEDDVVRLKAMAFRILNDMGIAGASLSDDLISEMCRFGAAEIHCIASVIGGIASQEAIKLLTRQFVPLEGALIYNGIDSTSLVLKF